MLRKRWKPTLDRVPLIGPDGLQRHHPTFAEPRVRRDLRKLA